MTDGSVSDEMLLEAVTPIWERILGTQITNPEDDFFVAGGDFLLLIDLVVEIGELYAVDFDYDKFFDAPTVSTLVAIIRSANKG